MSREHVGTLYKKTPDAKKWSGAYPHPITGKRVLVSTLYTDKQASRVALDRMIRETEQAAEGIAFPSTAHRKRPIQEHVKDYIDHCRHQRQDDQYVKLKETHLAWIIKETKATRLDDLNLESVSKALRTLIDNGRSARTHNSYRAILLAFYSWLKDAERIGGHSLHKLPKLDERSDRRLQRRALTAVELENLIRVARLRPLAEWGREVVKKPRDEKSGRKSWTKQPLTMETLEAATRRARRVLAKRPATIARLERLGLERSLIYKTLVLTGLRVGELSSLTVASVFLEHVPPFVRVAAADEKARRGADLPLRADLAEDLCVWIAGILTGNTAEAMPLRRKAVTSPRLFHIPNTLVKALYLDMQVAGIPQRDERGHIVDLHSLRRTLASHLGASGIAPKTAQMALRHADMDTTMQFYVDPKMFEVSAALNAMPGLRIGQSN